MKNISHPYLTDPTGREHLLQGERTRIGRGVENEIVITSKRVSREHARLIRADAKTILEDAGSTNGTLLNDERIRNTKELRDGDRITVGDVTFLFHDPDTTFRDSESVEMEVEPDAGIVRVNRRVISLSPKEFGLIRFLYSRRAQVCSKDEIAKAVWPEYQDGVYDYQIENLIRRVRDRIEPDPDNPQLLLTIRGMGYRLEV